jgi:hypothetical protein
MKTAISLPDSIFKEVEALAQQLESFQRILRNSKNSHSKKKLDLRVSFYLE